MSTTPPPLKASQRKVDRSAAAQAMNAIRRAARKKTGPGLRERKELRARQLERTGGAIEQDISGESQQVLQKAQDFQQSRSGDQMFASEANSVVVRLQRALWYVDVLMRGVNTDKRENIQTKRIEKARLRLQAAIREVESFGVQRQLVMRANWVLGRFQKWGEDHRKTRRTKQIEKIRTIIPDDWLKKTITRTVQHVEVEHERTSQVDLGLQKLKQFQPMHDSSSSEELESSSSENDEGEEGEEEGKTRSNFLLHDGFEMNEETASAVDTIVARRARRKDKEKEKNREIQREQKKMMKKMKKQRKKKKKKKRQLCTMRNVDEVTVIQKNIRRKSKSLHRSMVHQYKFLRPPSPEERWEEGMYSDYEEYDRRRVPPIEEHNELEHHAPTSGNNEHTRPVDGSDSGDSNGTNDGDIHNGDTNEANTISRDKLLKERQKHKIFSMDEILAMHAETDFGEDVATFLDGSGLVKNTGPAARTKFVRMMKVSYLDVRMKKLQRTKRVIAIIKKLKDMLRRVLLMPGDDDVIPGNAFTSKVASAAAEEGDHPEDIDPEDIDALLDAKGEKPTVLHEEDLDIFKRWAGKKVVAMEPLLSAEKTRATGMGKEEEDDGIYRFGQKNKRNHHAVTLTWVCKVCMQINTENALVCMVCGRPPNAPAIGWGLAKHRPRRTHPRFMHTFNQKIGRTIRQWEKQEQDVMEKRKQSGRALTMTEDFKENFFLRRKGGLAVP